MRLAPLAGSEPERTRAVNTLVDELVADGFIPEHKLRHELQDVAALSAGFGSPPLLRMERAAIIYFGIERYGVHVNGWVRDATNPDDPTPVAMWVGKRAMSKGASAGFDPPTTGSSHPCCPP